MLNRALKTIFNMSTARLIMTLTVATTEKICGDNASGSLEINDSKKSPELMAVNSAISYFNEYSCIGGFPSLLSPATQFGTFPRSHQNQDLFYEATYCSVAEILNLECNPTQLNSKNVDDNIILDFWGEGRIIASEVITGFTDAYNVNQENQKVSNGKNVGLAIPNRIPVRSYNNVDTSALIANDTFTYVTTMGSDIIAAAAKEMHRIVRKNNEARVIFYGEEKKIITEIQTASQDNFIHAKSSYQYEESLPDKLKVPTLRPLNVMVPIDQLLCDLSSHIENGNYCSATNIESDLLAYCREGYSQTGKIQQQIREIYANRTNAIAENSSYLTLSQR
jgi:hypothetical protein